jgi:hypothetical protein
MTPDALRVDSPVGGLGTALRVVVVVALGLSVAGASIGGRVGRVCAAIAIATIIAAPLLRVVVLSAHWYRSRDRRFAAVGLGLIAIVAAGAVLATL